MNVFSRLNKIFFYEAGAKKCYVSFYTFYTKNLKQLLFCLDVSKEDIIKVLCCLGICNRSRTPTRHKMRVSSRDMFKYNKTEQFFFQVCVIHFEYWLFAKFSHLPACQNKSRRGGEIFCKWTRGNSIFFPGTCFFYKQRFFSTQPQCCLTFS